MLDSVGAIKKEEDTNKNLIWILVNLDRSLSNKTQIQRQNAFRVVHCEEYFEFQVHRKSR